MADDLLHHRQDGEVRQRAIVVLLGSVVVILAAVAAALWAHYGTTVFFQTIAAGIAACF